jgi:large subunit ribosomal protein L30
MLRITLKRGYAGVPKTLRKTLIAMGLKKIRCSVVRNDIPAVRGMILRVAHLITVEEVQS